MEFRIIPFTAHISQGDGATHVANQMQQMIDDQGKEGWDYVRMDSVSTVVAGTSGCFGLGGEPARTTSCSVLVFRK